MDHSDIDRTRQLHRGFIAWFSSPRVAVRTALRLAQTVPGSRVHVRRSDDHGAEGPVVALAAEIPWLWSTVVTRQMAGLGVAVMWEPDGAREDVRRAAA
jgi:hypothetical protein